MFDVLLKSMGIDPKSFGEDIAKIPQLLQSLVDTHKRIENRLERIEAALNIKEGSDNE